MAEETKQHQYKAQYDDQLARKRYEDQLAQQVSFVFLENSDFMPCFMAASSCVYCTSVLIIEVFF